MDASAGDCAIGASTPAAGQLPVNLGWRFSWKAKRASSVPWWARRGSLIDDLEPASAYVHRGDGRPQHPSLDLSPIPSPRRNQSIYSNATNCKARFSGFIHAPSSLMKNRPPRLLRKRSISPIASMIGDNPPM